MHEPEFGPYAQYPREVFRARDEKGKEFRLDLTFHAGELYHPFPQHHWDPDQRAWKVIYRHYGVTPIPTLCGTLNATRIEVHEGGRCEAHGSVYPHFDRELFHPVFWVTESDRLLAFIDGCCDVQEREEAERGMPDVHHLIREDRVYDQLDARYHFCLNHITVLGTYRSLMYAQGRVDQVFHQLQRRLRKRAKAVQHVAHQAFWYYAHPSKSGQYSLTHVYISKTIPQTVGDPHALPWEQQDWEGWDVEKLDFEGGDGRLLRDSGNGQWGSYPKFEGDGDDGDGYH